MYYTTHGVNFCDYSASQDELVLDVIIDTWGKRPQLYSQAIETKTETRTATTFVVCSHDLPNFSC